MRSFVLTKIRKFCLPKISKKQCFQIRENNIKMMEGTKVAVYIAFNAVCSEKTIKYQKMYYC